MQSSRLICGGFLPLSDRPTNIAIIGFGNHVRKNMLRSFDVAGLTISHIFVRDAQAYAQANPAHAPLFSSDLGKILADPDVDAVYVATPISSHFEYATAALEAGKHVLCEKPLAQFLSQAKDLVALADRKGLLLGEMAMYRYHQQYLALRNLIADKASAGERLLGLRARFSIPDLSPGDIRYRADMGGGALLDVGYYPLSLIVSLLGWPDDVSTCGFVSPELGVDLSGQAFMRFGSVGAQCFWAIGATYANEVEISFSRSTYAVPRAFSKPPEFVTQIARTEPNGQQGDPLIIPGDDQFCNILAEFVSAMRTDDANFRTRIADEAILTARMLDAVQAKLHSA